MLNRVFPVKHIKAGTPTMFANLLYANHKIHTVRMDEKGLWAKRCDEVKAGRRYFPFVNGRKDRTVQNNER